MSSRHEEWTGDETITVREIVRRLNRINQLDPVAFGNLVSHRIGCGPSMAADPFVQVAQQGGIQTVGFLGILNGLLGADRNGWGPITADFVPATTNRIREFILTRTEEHDPAPPALPDPPAPVEESTGEESSSGASPDPDQIVVEIVATKRPPLPEGNPRIGSFCPGCATPFKIGDATTNLPGKGSNTGLYVWHWDCALKLQSKPCSCSHAAAPAKPDPGAE